MSSASSTTAQLHFSRSERTCTRLGKAKFFDKLSCFVTPAPPGFESHHDEATPSTVRKLGVSLLFCHVVRRSLLHRLRLHCVASADPRNSALKLCSAANWETLCYDFEPPLVAPCYFQVQVSKQSVRSHDGACLTANPSNCNF